MREIILNKLMIFVNKGFYSKEELEKMRYGFEAIYIFITKSVVIFAIAYCFKIVDLTILFIICYGLLRSFACGLHASKSWVCLVFSGITFIGIPYICKVISLNFTLKVILSFICIITISLYAPADTKKRPIINKNKRIFLKCTSIGITLIYILGVFYLENKLLANILIFSLLLECIIISPITYKIFKLPFANYKKYINVSKEGG